MMSSRTSKRQSLKIKQVVPGLVKTSSEKYGEESPLIVEFIGDDDIDRVIFGINKPSGKNFFSRDRTIIYLVMSKAFKAKWRPHDSVNIFRELF